MELINTLSAYEPGHKSLGDLIAGLPQLPPDADLGEDIAEAHAVLLDDDVPEEQKREALFAWTARNQPCLFGRLGSHQGRGEASGFLIMFNSRELAYAAPSAELLELCQEVSNLYLVESAPIVPDVIYTEAVPLRRQDGQLTIFKAGCNIFYAGAHDTINHDRRLPGGLMFSMNSPGHYANSLVTRGIVEDFEEAVEFVRETAFRSIGNGGIGCPHASSASWHNTTEEQPDDLPERKRPKYVPDDFDPTRYSAVYHTDVLVPTAVTTDPRSIEPGYEAMGAEVWKFLILDYITGEEFGPEHVNYALFNGHPIEECAKYHNPWAPRVAHNQELFAY